MFRFDLGRLGRLGFCKSTRSRLSRGMPSQDCPHIAGSRSSRTFRASATHQKLLCYCSPRHGTRHQGSIKLSLPALRRAIKSPKKDPETAGTPTLLNSDSIQTLKKTKEKGHNPGANCPRTRALPLTRPVVDLASCPAGGCPPPLSSARGRGCGLESGHSCGLALRLCRA